MGQDERANGAEREPGEENEAEGEDEERVSVAGLQRLGGGLCSRRADAEAAGGRLEAVGIEISPERENGGDDEPASRFARGLPPAVRPAPRFATVARTAFRRG